MLQLGRIRTHATRTTNKRTNKEKKTYQKQGKDGQGEGTIKGAKFKQMRDVIIYRDLLADSVLKFGLLPLLPVVSAARTSNGTDLKARESNGGTRLLHTFSCICRPHCVYENYRMCLFRGQ